MYDHFLPQQQAELALFKQRQARNEPVPCVYSRHAVAYDSILNLQQVNDDFLGWIADPALGKNPNNHSERCRYRKTGVATACTCWEAGTNDTISYTDGQWLVDYASGTYRLDPNEHADLIIVETQLGLHVVKAYDRWLRGLCSPSCPGQCDAEADGSIYCYRLPDYLLSWERDNEDE